MTFLLLRHFVVTGLSSHYAMTSYGVYLALYQCTFSMNRIVSLTWKLLIYCFCKYVLCPPFLELLLNTRESSLSFFYVSYFLSLNSVLTLGGFLRSIFQFTNSFFRSV